MYAHVNVWRLNNEGAAWTDDAAREIGAALQVQPGFRAYTLVRTGEWEMRVGDGRRHGVRLAGRTRRRASRGGAARPRARDAAGGGRAGAPRRQRADSRRRAGRDAERRLIPVHVSGREADDRPPRGRP